MHILIIEDDRRMSDYVKTAFERSGFTCQAAYDGEAGLAAALQGGFDAAIVDVMLPKLDGIELIRRVRASGVHLPMIVLSARGSVEAKVRGLEAGGDDYLSKPFSMTELIARVQALIRRAAAVPESNVLKVANLEMDVMTHRVTRAGERIELQPLEYQLLEYLLRNKGRIVSKATIMERVWDYAFNPNTNAIEVRVSRLRDKIDKNFTPKLLHTVRRFGYVLEERADGE
jgi:two-component system, OmpR family, response regulator